MCTVSWLREPAGYQVFFNRDELRTRAPGLPPEAGSLRGVRFVAPRDGDHLGTWIGANELGLTLGLLNRYEESPGVDAGGPTVSRGHLVSGLLDAPHRDGVRDRLDAFHLGRFRPFTLVVFAPGAPAHLLGWDGRELHGETAPESGLVLTSSGHDQAGAARIRGALFEAARTGGPWTAEELDLLHRSHHPERGPFSVCMHRSDAVTVSYTRVVVTPTQVVLSCTAGAPCETPHSDTLRLHRRPPPPVAA
jgi:hypothetical protein